MYNLYIDMGKNVIIRLKNKKSGVVYVYYGQSAYSKDGRCTTKGLRKLIGKMNSQDEFEPNSTFLLMPPGEQLATGLVQEPYFPVSDREAPAANEYEEKFYGYTAVLEAAAKKTGMYEALRKVFPNDYLVMMSMAEALVCYPNRPLYSPRRFHNACWHTNISMPSEGAITSALKAVTPENRERFFRQFNLNRPDGDQLVVALDTTSISTYSSMLALARSGYNKKGDSLPQINLLMVCDAVTGIPIHYRNVAGNESDSVSVKASVENMVKENVRKGTVFTMDRGFCTLDNMQLILKKGFTFLVCMPEKCQYYDEAVDAVIADIENTENYVPSIGRYCATHNLEIPLKRPGRGKNSYTMTAYVYRDPLAHADQKKKLSDKFASMLRELDDNPSLWKKNNRYGKYFTKNDGGAYVHNRAAQGKALSRCGLFVVIGPAGWTAEKVHRIYKQRDIIEKDYENLKVRMRRPRHSLDEHLEGKVFIVFLISVMEAYIRQILRNNLLDVGQSMEDNMDVICNAKWRKPEGKKFKEGSWIDLTLDQMKMLHMMGVPGIDKLTPNIGNLVNNDLLHRQGKKAKRGRKSKAETS